MLHHYTRTKTPTRYRWSGVLSQGNINVLGRNHRQESKEVMKPYYWVLVASLAFLGTGCRKAPSSQQAPQLLKPATIKDIMDSMVNPSGEFVFESVYQISDERGIREKAPQTDADWEAVREHVVVLLEAPNLLVMPGRKVAPPDVKSQNPGIELEPAQIQQLIDGDRLAFIRRARGLQDAAAVAMKAVDAKNKDALFQAEDGVDKACENCHLHYWYPNDERARAVAEGEGIVY
jgi:hypothetical protein